jgi:hypothetical protein
VAVFDQRLHVSEGSVFIKMDAIGVSQGGSKAANFDLIELDSYWLGMLTHLRRDDQFIE